MYIQDWNINLALPLMAKNNIETVFFHFHIIFTFYIKKVMHTYSTYKMSVKKLYKLYLQENYFIASTFF